MGKVGKMGDLKAVKKCDKVEKRWDILREKQGQF
jgi:hypothetical protein